MPDRIAACDIPQQTLLYLYDKAEQRRLPLSEIPVTVERMLFSTAAMVGIGKFGNPERYKRVEFSEWQWEHISRGNLPVPYWVMETARAEERLGLMTPAYKAERENRLYPMEIDHDAWGLVHYYRLWPVPGSPHESWIARYDQLDAEGYGDLWFVPDYNSLPELDPATILAERKNRRHRKG